MPDTILSPHAERVASVSTHLALYVAGRMETGLIGKIQFPAALTLADGRDEVELLHTALDVTATELFTRALALSESDHHDSQARAYAGHVASALHMVDYVTNAAQQLVPNARMMPEAVRQVLLASLAWAYAHRPRYSTTSPSVPDTVTEAIAHFTEALKAASHNKPDA